MRLVTYYVDIIPRDGIYSEPEKPRYAARHGQRVGCNLVFDSGEIHKLPLVRIHRKTPTHRRLACRGHTISWIENERRVIVEGAYCKGNCFEIMESLRAPIEDFLIPMSCKLPADIVPMPYDLK